MVSKSLVVRRRRFPRKGSKIMRTVARREAKKVLKRQIETKFFDGKFDDTPGVSNTPISYTGFNAYMTDDWTSGSPVSMVQGVDENEYLGREIRPMYLQIRYAITMNAADVINTVSLIVFQAKGLFTASAASAANQYQYANTTSAPISPVHRDYNDRLRVLARRIVSGDSDDLIHHGKINIKMGRMSPIRFNDSSGSVETNPIFMSLISDSVAANHPTIRATWRLYYKDA